MMEGRQQVKTRVEKSPFNVINNQAAATRGGMKGNNSMQNTSRGGEVSWVQGNPSTKNANTQMNMWHAEQSLPRSRALTSLPTSRGARQTMFFVATSLLANFASLALMRSFASNPLRGKSWTLKVHCVTVCDIIPLWIGRRGHYLLYQYYTSPVLLFITHR